MGPEDVMDVLRGGRKIGKCERERWICTSIQLIQLSIVPMFFPWGWAAFGRIWENIPIQQNYATIKVRQNYF